MELQTHLAALAQPDWEARRDALETALEKEGFVPEIQTEEEGEDRPRPARNYLLPPKGEALCPLLCAHYDAHPGSPGANDNAAAVCILIELAKTLREKGVDAGFAFLDGEENGHTGAKLFESARTREYSVVVNLDVCGYGDTLTVYAKGGEKKPAAAVFCDKKRLEAHHGRMVRYIPEGDECCFPSRLQPVLSIAVMPQWDTKFLDAIAAHGGGLLGRPPEMEMMLGEMEVMSTMHGGFRDKVQWVQPAAMQQVYDYLLDALCAKPRQSKRFGLF
ncbi:MAG: M28 family peptidase [Gemmiger sp.]